MWEYGGCNFLPWCISTKSIAFLNFSPPRIFSFPKRASMTILMQSNQYLVQIKHSCVGIWLSLSFVLMAICTRADAPLIIKVSISLLLPFSLTANIYWLKVQNDYTTQRLKWETALKSVLSGLLIKKSLVI